MRIKETMNEKKENNIFFIFMSQISWTWFSFVWEFFTACVLSEIMFEVYDFILFFISFRICDHYYISSLVLHSFFNHLFIYFWFEFLKFKTNCDNERKYIFLSVYLFVWLLRQLNSSNQNTNYILLLGVFLLLSKK